MDDWKINSFLLQKGYKLMKHWDSDTSWDRGSIYGYHVTDKNVKKAESLGVRLIWVNYRREKGKWVADFNYSTPDSIEKENAEMYCNVNGFQQIWD